MHQHAQTIADIERQEQSIKPALMVAGVTVTVALVMVAVLFLFTF